MSNERASLLPADLDLSEFTPAPRATPRAKPDKLAIRKAAEARGFGSREPEQVAEPAPVPPSAVEIEPVPARATVRRRSRQRITGRNQQLNIKATEATITRFYDITDAQGWVLGETLEQALDALEREIVAKG